ncbi:ABC transporter substrate-binding protein [Paraburkholderia lacunae]|uniref:Probable sugar-binding periplasmic protein n=1 Tax=Paraburkholderia lacunae TaxID=2211104 RepID=A0A370MYM7_9BURK|nr:ABC transporter substrate-binding protein [Paraburkholderia lacunae]RDJ98459.1 carbohydrate ABC transporter substrate-binding protein [Paraburkholderia lacunae]
MKLKSKQGQVLARVVASTVAGLAISGIATAQTQQVEVVHQWTSSSESYALQALKDGLQKKGMGWKDSAIAGDDGANQQQALQARLAAGNAPAAAQAQPQLLYAYAEQNELASLDSYAKAGNWDHLLTPELIPYLKYKGTWYGVPMDEHRENMFWINKKILQKYGDKVPTTWDEFNTLAEKMKKDGIIPVALGGEDWQEAEIFSDLVLGMGGPAFYKKAIINHDPATVQSPTMVKVFDELRKIISYTDPNRAGRDWNVATQMVIDGKAGMQIHADWAKGEFLRAGKKPGVDFVCAATPGSGHAFIWVLDSFAFFKQKNPAAQANQALLANTVMDPDVQQNFNLRKGSLPPRIDVAQDKFDDCAKTNFADRAAGNKAGEVIPSFIENAALERDIRAAYVDVVTQFVNTPSMTSADAVKKLVAAAKNT